MKITKTILVSIGNTTKETTVSIELENPPSWEDIEKIVKTIDHMLKLEKEDKNE